MRASLSVFYVYYAECNQEAQCRSHTCHKQQIHQPCHINCFSISTARPSRPDLDVAQGLRASSLTIAPQMTLQRLAPHTAHRS